MRSPPIDWRYVQRSGALLQLDVLVERGAALQWLAEQGREPATTIACLIGALLILVAVALLALALLVVFASAAVERRHYQ